MPPSDDYGDDFQDQKPVKPKVPNWRIDQWFQRIDAEKRGQLRQYHLEVIRFNKATNLISMRTVENADIVHFSDCLLGGEIILKSTPARRIFDIGSGNGFPGLVLAILDPLREFILVDSDTRRIEFLKHMIDHIGLDNVRVLPCRLEKIEPGLIETGVSRAFAPLSKAMALSRQAFVEGGRYYHFKTESWNAEMLNIPLQVGRYWEQRVVGEYQLPKVSIKLAIIESERRKP